METGNSRKRKYDISFNVFFEFSEVLGEVA